MGITGPKIHRRRRAVTAFSSPSRSAFSRSSAANKSVTFRNMNRDIVSKHNYERVGRDGGIYLVIEIEAKNRTAGLQVAGKVKKALKSLGR
jgi:hypothetical protein